jgi:hypothetical protein
MASLWEYPELEFYVLEKLEEDVGPFFLLFLNACQHADGEDFELLKPVIEQLRRKYPLREQALRGRWGGCNDQGFRKEGHYEN